MIDDFSVDGRNCDIFATYKFESERKGEENQRGQQSLNVGVKDLEVGDLIEEVYVEFTQFLYSEEIHSTAKCRNDYYENAAAREAFNNLVRPFLKERLPEYMARLLKDKS